MYGDHVDTGYIFLHVSVSSLLKLYCVKYKSTLETINVKLKIPQNIFVGELQSF